MPSLRAIVASAAAAILSRTLPDLPPGKRASLARELARDRFSPPARAMGDFAEQYLHAWRNRQHGIDRNGEIALMQRLAPFRPRIVFDVGANVGDWAHAALATLPEAQVHAFEISPDVATTLRQRSVSFGGRIVVNEAGLADRSGTIPIRRPAGVTTQTTMLEPGPGEDDHEIVAEAARVERGDDYVRDRAIARIDLLKIDVEGAEERVLRGFDRCLAEGRIAVLQFEYTRANAFNGFPLRDAYRLLEGHGFVLGKLYPEGVGFKDYAPADDDFIDANYVACHARHADLVAALRCPPLSA